MISFEQVSKFVLSDISIYIPQGKTVGLIGPCGAGKTTFMKLAGGLLLPESGKVRIMGLEPVSKKKQLGKQIGTLWADVPLLYAEDTVAGNFDMLREIYGIKRDYFRRTYQELSEGLEFAVFQNQKVKDLSLGQRRRAEIGAALLHHPRLLFMDEPTTGLDENGKLAFYKIIKERNKEGMTFLISSHNMAEICKLCSRVVLLDKGELTYYGETSRLQKQFVPIESILITLEGKIPDLQDLPILKYTVNGNRMTLYYREDYVTAAEILKLILPQTIVKEVKIHKSDLSDAIIQISKEKKGGKDEQFD